MPTSRSRGPGRPGVFVLVGGLLLALLGVVGVTLRGGAPRAVAPAATPTIDPRLVIRPRSVPVRAPLTDGAEARGTLYPAYPGRNTLHLVIRWHGRPLSPTAPLTLVATMRGMAMRPIQATLVARGGSYAGTVTLPMFGAYQARIAVVTPHGRAHGTLTLRLSLPQF
ncbi:MAG: hypothetical protein LC769_04475 [Chloroflexi bacterium]|nr:hypothetical protein [Chloroflexota bacterium]